MITIRLHKAEPLHLAEKIEGVSIDILDPLPLPQNQYDLTETFSKDAIMLMEALKENLPGGTLDKLSAMMIVHYYTKHAQSAK